MDGQLDYCVQIKGKELLINFQDRKERATHSSNGTIVASVIAVIT